MNDITFVPRTHKNSNNIKASSIDAIKLIDYVLSLDKNNRIVVNSQLYKMASDQYNESVRNTLIRPDIPTWFCGKIEPTTGFLLMTDTDIRIQAGISSSPIPVSALNIDLSGATAYSPDKCLSAGTPGSPGYSNCVSNATENIDTGIGAAGLNWSASVYSVAEPPPLPEENSNSSGRSHNNSFGHILNDIGDWFAQLGW